MAARVLAGQRAGQAGCAVQSECLRAHQSAKRGRSTERINGRAVVGLGGAGQTRHRQSLGADRACGRCQRHVVVGAAVAVADDHAVGRDPCRANNVLAVEDLRQRWQRVATEHRPAGHARCGAAGGVAVVGLGVSRGTDGQWRFGNGGAGRDAVGTQNIVRRQRTQATCHAGDG